MTDNAIWIRIFDNLGSGSAFLMMACVLFSYLRVRDIGHRALIVHATIFCGLVSASHFCGAWDLWTGGHLLALWVRVVCAAYSAFFGLAFMAAKDDLLITLRTTEAHDQRRKDLARDLAQMRLLREYLTDSTLATSQDLVQQQNLMLNRGHG